MKTRKLIVAIVLGAVLAGGSLAAVMATSKSKSAATGDACLSCCDEAPAVASTAAAPAATPAK